MVPPTPPQSRAEGLSTVDTTNEIFPGNADISRTGPYGLGVRVPMIVISPWSKGGWVNSEVFDHTSLIRFIEQRFGRQHPGIIETNITAVAARRRGRSDLGVRLRDAERRDRSAAQHRRLRAARQRPSSRLRARAAGRSGAAAAGAGHAAGARRAVRAVRRPGGKPDSPGAQSGFTSAIRAAPRPCFRCARETMQ